MKNYCTPASINPYNMGGKGLNVVPLIAGAVGTLAGKAVKAAVLGGAMALGEKAIQGNVHSDNYLPFQTANLRVLSASGEC